MYFSTPIKSIIYNVQRCIPCKNALFCFIFPLDGLFDFAFPNVSGFTSFRKLIPVFLLPYKKKSKSVDIIKDNRRRDSRIIKGYTGTFTESTPL